MRHILACDHVCVRACDTHFCYQTGFQTLQNNSSAFPDLENIIQEGLRTRLIARASFSERFWEIQKKFKFYENFHLILLSTESELQSESGAALLGIQRKIINLKAKNTFNIFELRTPGHQFLIF